MSEQYTSEYGANRDAAVAGSKTAKFPARFDLITPIGLRRLAETCGEGFKKYGANNWLQGFPAEEMLNHALAHINAYIAGDRSEDHLAHAAWNLLGTMHFEEVRPELFAGLPPPVLIQGTLFKPKRQAGLTDAELLERVEATAP